MAVDKQEISKPVQRKDNTKIIGIVLIVLFVVIVIILVGMLVNSNAKNTAQPELDISTVNQIFTDFDNDGDVDLIVFGKVVINNGSFLQSQPEQP